jgi:hypothetical protein
MNYLAASIRNIVGSPYQGRNAVVFHPALSDPLTRTPRLMSNIPRQHMSALWTNTQSVLTFPFRYLGKMVRKFLHTVGRAASDIVHGFAEAFFLMLTLVFVLNVSALIYELARRYITDRENQRRIKRRLEDLEQQRLLQDARMQSYGRRYQAAETEVPASNREGHEPTRVLPASTRHVSSSEVNLHVYIQHAYCERIRWLTNPRLGPCWTTIIRGLGDIQNSHVSVPYYLTSSMLEHCLSSPDDNAVLRRLIIQAHQVGLNSVADAADVYLRPLLYGVVYYWFDVSNGNYAPLKLGGQPIRIQMDTLSDGTHTVRSFFGAINAILYNCIPPNQSLREYLRLFTLFTILLKRALWQPYLSQATEFNPKVALLVCLSTSDSRRSEARVGFSACGPRKVKEQIIHDRTEHLPVLKEIPIHDLPWQVGNCAEDETFTHLMLLEESFRQLLNRPGPGMIAVSLTVDLKDLGPVRPCGQCQDLFHKVRSPFTVTVDLTPSSTARTVGRI